MKKKKSEMNSCLRARPQLSSPPLLPSLFIMHLKLDMGLNCSKPQAREVIELYSNDAGACGAAIHNGPILNLQNLKEDWIVASSDDKTLSVSDCSLIREDRSYSPILLKGHTKAVNRILTLDSNTIVSASRDLSIRKWNIERATYDLTIDQAHGLNISALAHSSSHLFSGSRDYSVKAWDLPTKTCVSEYSCPRNIVTCLSYGEVTGVLYQGSEDLCVRAWDPRLSHSSAPAAHYGGYVYFPLCLSLQRDENIMVTGCKGFNSVGCGVVVWDVRNAQTPLQELKAHSQDVVSCLFSPNSHDLLLTASKDGSVVAWDVKTMEKKEILQINRKPLSSLCHVSSRENLFAASAMDGSLSLFRFDGGGGEGREFEVVFQTEGVEEGLQSGSAH